MKNIKILIIVFVLLLGCERYITHKENTLNDVIVNGTVLFSDTLCGKLCYSYLVIDVDNQDFGIQTIQVSHYTATLYPVGSRIKIDVSKSCNWWFGCYGRAYVPLHKNTPNILLKSIVEAFLLGVLFLIWIGYQERKIKW